MRILLAREVMAMLRASRPTLYRWLRESRTGVGTFPQPISEPGRQLRWNADDIEAFCQARATPPRPASMPSPTKVRAEKEQRREATWRGLAEHGIFLTNDPAKTA
jgi:predicted DNA-binding transcriptional regulator AlpA